MEESIFLVSRLYFRLQSEEGVLSIHHCWDRLQASAASGQTQNYEAEGPCTMEEGAGGVWPGG